MILPTLSRAWPVATLTGALLCASLTALAPSTATSSVPAPVRTIEVARHGDDSASGSSGSPLRSIGAAIRRAPSGSTIVVHGGSYHESLTVPPGKRLSITAAPGARVWLDGARRVLSWRPAALGYVHAGWDVEFDASPTYHWGAPDNTQPGWSFVNGAHPMAAHPDQVWVDGRSQRQVRSLSKLAPGRFYVDDDANRLYLGSDPTGRTVRASSLDTALAVRGAGTSVSGINVRRFAPSVPHMGAVTVEAAGVTLARLAIRNNATTGLHVSASGAVIRRVHTGHNGMLGLSATYADGLRLVRVVSRHNNTEGFNFSPVAGGAKIGRTRGVRVLHSTFSENAGTGLWFDESTRRITVLDSTIRGNRHHGMSLEISARATVADVVIAGNADDGIKVNNTSNVLLWNDTVVGNGRPINIVQDDRDAADPDTPGHDPRRPVPDRGMPWINRSIDVHNNILSRSRPDANCLLCVEDFSGRFSAEELRVTASGNVYQRPSRTAPTWIVVWSRGAGDPAVFTTLTEFHRETGQEARHLAVVGKPVVTPRLRATPAVQRQAGRVAHRLPAAVARQLGRIPGARHLGAWAG